MNQVFRRSISLIGVVAGLFLMVYVSPVSGAQNRHPLGLPSMQTPATTGKIVVKLRPETGLIMGRRGPVVRPGLDLQKSHLSHTHRERLQNLVASLFNGGKLEKRFPSAEVTPAGKGGFSSAPDMALYAHIQLADQGRPAMLKLVAALNADPAVWVAYLEPVAVPAALGFDAFTGAVPEMGTHDLTTVSPATTPDFEADQGYLGLAPVGIGALAMREQPGALGSGVMVIDVEGAWLWDHEDLPDPAINLGTNIDDLSWRNHGTAVLGEIRGTDNGLGVTGITPSCSVGSSSISETSVAAALLAAADNLSRGDLILIELHGAGPNSTGSGQFGYVPMEFWQDTFDAIRLITGRGILVIEAAGNGYQDLDSSIYMDLFDRNTRNSGAIMCGATAGNSYDAAEFSNHGTRVDLNGWGWDVTTCGYGDLQGDPEPEATWYTSHFSGTSSASPIVTGSVASLQGMVQAHYGFDLDANLAREILQQTGTSLNAGHLIGTRPNLVAAFALAETGLGEVTGTVTDATTGTAIPGVSVEITGSNAFAITNNLGQWRLPLFADGYSVKFSSYYYETGQQNTTISGGQSTTLDISLNPLPQADISGSVTGNGIALEGCMVTVLNQPFGSTVTDGSGFFTIADVPIGYESLLLFDGVPGFGARTASAVPIIEGYSEAHVELPVIDEDFSGGLGGFTASNTLWSFGNPPVEISDGAFTGLNCWGIGMDGLGYYNNVQGSLYSPDYYLPESADHRYYLSFHIFSATEAGYDGVNVMAIDGTDTTLIQPLDQYFDPYLGGLNNTPGWSGYSERWRGVVFDINDYAGGTFSFMLSFGSDSGVEGPGFLIDGICINNDLEVTPVPETNTIPNPFCELSASPNPFNPTVQIYYSLVSAGPLQLTVFDVRGRKIRTLWDGETPTTEGTVSWNGKDDSGRSLPSGVYLVQARVPDASPTLQRVVLAK